MAARGGVTVACEPHKLEVAGAIPAPATSFSFQFLSTEVAPIPAIGAPLLLNLAILPYGRNQAREVSESCSKTENFRISYALRNGVHCSSILKRASVAQWQRGEV